MYSLMSNFTFLSGCLRSQNGTTVFTKAFPPRLSTDSTTSNGQPPRGAEDSFSKTMSPFLGMNGRNRMGGGEN